MNNEAFFDAPLPPAMAQKAEELGLKKVQLPLSKMFMLSVLAGAFVALGAIFATTVSAGSLPATGAGAMPYGLVRLLMGLVFSLGLILVVVGGAELFTGNILIVMAFINGKVSFGQLMLNWLIVYLGNFVGSVGTALIMFLTKQHTFGGGSVGLSILYTAEAKTSLEFFQAVALGMMCNALVCLAIWLVYSARTTTDKVLAIIPPVAAFVTAGFEHSIANMYFIPVALFVKFWGGQDFFTKIGHSAADFPHLTLGNFFIANLLPVTIGNIIGGAMMVGLVYWFIYLRSERGS